MISHILARIQWNGLSSLHQRRHIARVEKMLNAMSERFSHLKHFEQVKLKHLRWLQEVWLTSQGFAEATLVDYKRTLALMVAALDSDRHWQQALKITRDPKKGGRPQVCRAVRTRRRASRC